MSKSHKKIKATNNGSISLKTPVNRSHNRDSDDERVKALVRFLARRAAVEDYRMYQEALASPENIDGGN